MAVGKRIQSAIDSLGEGRIDDALIQVAIALDATAQRELGRRGASCYKAYLEQNLPIITKFGMRVRIERFRLACDHPTIRPGPDGLCSLADVLYHAVRCALVHEGQVAKEVRFIDEARIMGGGTATDPLCLPSELLHGLMMAVILSPANAAERCQISAMATFHKISIMVPINQLWGRRDEVLWLADVADHALLLPRGVDANGSELDGAGPSVDGGVVSSARLVPPTSDGFASELGAPVPPD